MSDDSARVNAAIAHTLTWCQTVRGVRWGLGDHRVLLLHEPGSDLDAWGPLPREVASALAAETRAFDLPGHGLSDDPWNPERLPAVISELIAPAGSAAVPTIVIAAGLSALAALQVADKLDVAGLVALSPTGQSRSIPRSPRVPKLFFAGSQAGDDLDDARRLASGCGGWAAVTAVPVDVRGTTLLETEWNRRIVEAIGAFIRDCHYGRPTPRPRALTPLPPSPTAVRRGRSLTS